MNDTDLPVDGHPRSAYTALTENQVAEIRERAHAAGRLVDPTVLAREKHRVAAVARSHPHWAQIVLGRPYAGVGADTWTAFLTLAYAYQAEPVPPSDPVLAEDTAQQQAAQKAEAREVENIRHDLNQVWSRLRDRMPVPVRVLYNYSGARHLEFYSSGADHIVLDADLDVARLHRKANTALCSTASARRRQIFDTSTRLESEDTRIPTCRACLAVAARLAGPDLGADADLLTRHSRRAQSRRVPGLAQ